MVCWVAVDWALARAQVAVSIRPSTHEGEESSRRRYERESNWYGEGPEVGVDGLGACEEWGSCRGRVKKN